MYTVQQCKNLIYGHLSEKDKAHDIIAVLAKGSSVFRQMLAMK